MANGKIVLYLLQMLVNICKIMNKLRHILYLVVIAFMQTPAYAQLLNVRIGSDALVEDAIKDAIVVVESKYCIQDVKSGQKYGRNDKPYFNTITFLGCKTDKGVITSETTIKPWTVDNLFDKYRDNNKYRPLLDSTLVIRSLPIDTAQTIDLAKGLTFNNDTTLICVGINSRIDGLTISTNDSDVTNWIVWIKESLKNDSKESSNFEYNIIKKSVEFSKGAVVIDTPNSTNSYVGGLYISAKVISVGLVEFSLAGIIEENSGKWMIEPIYVNTFPADNENIDVTTSPVSNDSDEDLTPVNEKNKEKKKKTKASKKK